MKAIVAVVFLAVLAAGCNNQSKELEQQVLTLQKQASELNLNLADREQYLDEVIGEINEVYRDLEQARGKEGEIVQRTEPGGEHVYATSVEARTAVKQNIEFIGTTLKESRKRISNLQARLKNSKSELASLNTLLESLRSSLKEREEAMATLETRVKGLEANIASQTLTIEAQTGTIEQQKKEIETAYYVIGTKEELKEKGIINDEGGFLWGLLGSTTTLSSGVDQSLFTPINKSNDKVLHVNGEIDEILPRRQDVFFTTKQADEFSSELAIVEPNQFWESNYLVIVVN